MKRVVIVFSALVLALVLLPAIASAQGEVTVAQAKALYARWTQVDAWLAGYEKEPVCVDAASLGKDPALGATGYYLVKASLLDGTVDALKPEALLMDTLGNVVGASYRSTVAGASLFGQELKPLKPGVWNLHVWFIPNLNGTFADFNPGISCPAVEGTPTPTPTPPTGDVTLPWGLMALGGVAMLGLGFGLLRKGAARA